MFFSAQYLAAAIGL